jgi:hypothetical protein
MAKGKGDGKDVVVTFDEQLKLLNERRGVPVADAKNVFNGLVTVQKELIEEYTEKGVSRFAFETPIGGYGFLLRPEETRRTSDGKMHRVTEHYEGYAAFPTVLLNLANSKFDLTVETLSDDEVKTAKVA